MMSDGNTNRLTNALRRANKQIATLRRELSSARLVALEEAAKECEKYAEGKEIGGMAAAAFVCAEAIRLLSGEGK